MQEQEIIQRYQHHWSQFVEGLNEVQEAVGRAAANSASLHAIVKGIHWTPYHLTHDLVNTVEVEATTNNVGAATGLFFELAVAAALIPYVRARCPGVHVERNCCTDRSEAHLPRDPDLYFRSGEDRAVVEIKVSPKRRDLDHVRRVREHYEAAGIAFFLVGGHVSLSRKLLEEYADQEWACFLSSSSRNAAVLEQLPSLDAVAERLVARLRCS